MAAPQTGPAARGGVTLAVSASLSDQQRRLWRLEERLSRLRSQDLGAADRGATPPRAPSPAPRLPPTPEPLPAPWPLIAATAVPVALAVPAAAACSCATPRGGAGASAASSAQLAEYLQGVASRIRDLDARLLDLSSAPARPMATSTLTVAPSSTVERRAQEGAGPLPQPGSSSNASEACWRVDYDVRAQAAGSVEASVVAMAEARQVAGQGKPIEQMVYSDQTAEGSQARRDGLHVHVWAAPQPCGEPLWATSLQDRLDAWLEHAGHSGKRPSSRTPLDAHAGGHCMSEDGRTAASTADPLTSEADAEPGAARPHLTEWAEGLTGRFGTAAGRPPWALQQVDPGSASTWSATVTPSVGSVTRLGGAEPTLASVSSACSASAVPFPQSSSVLAPAVSPRATLDFSPTSSGCANQGRGDAAANAAIAAAEAASAAARAKSASAGRRRAGGASVFDEIIWPPSPQSGVGAAVDIPRPYSLAPSRSRGGGCLGESSPFVVDQADIAVFQAAGNKQPQPRYVCITPEFSERPRYGGAGWSEGNTQRPAVEMTSIVTSSWQPVVLGGNAATRRLTEPSRPPVPALALSDAMWRNEGGCGAYVPAESCASARSSGSGSGWARLPRETPRSERELPQGGPRSAPSQHAEGMHRTQQHQVIVQGPTFRHQEMALPYSDFSSEASLSTRGGAFTRGSAFPVGGSSARATSGSGGCNAWRNRMSLPHPAAVAWAK